MKTTNNFYFTNTSEGTIKSYVDTKSTGQYAINIRTLAQRAGVSIAKCRRIVIRWAIAQGYVTAIENTYKVFVTRTIAA